MKLKLGLFAAFMFALLLIPPKAVFAEEQLDQQCSLSPDETVPLNFMTAYQTFIPTLDRLTKVSIYAGGPAGAFTVAVQTNAGATLVSSDLSINGSSWYDFAFSAQEVTPGAIYRVVVSSNAMNNNTWANSHSAGCNANGQAYLNGGTYGADWLFKSYGYNQSSGDVTPQTEDSSNTGGTQITDSNISAAIKSPTELKAEYTTVADKKGAKLTWKKSTTDDIDGYILFRSETQGKGYTKVGTVTKDKLEYFDETVTAGKTYYYIVRAYKGNLQSANSTEATLTVPAATKTAQPVTPDTVDTGIFHNLEMTPLTWVLSGLVVVLTGVFILLTLRRKKSIKSL